MLFGAPVFSEEEDDPPCRGEIAEPLIELCRETADQEDEPACTACACEACYPSAVSPRRGELADDGTLIHVDCLAEHCTEACNVQTD
jgi:hypothetical protein